MSRYSIKFEEGKVMTLEIRKTSAKTTLKTTPQINAQKVSISNKVDVKNRHNQIAKAAYYLAQNENFKGDSVTHWLQAEASIDGKLASK